jgi:hypothetical protein
MKCLTCSDKMHRGIVAKGTFSKQRIKDAEARFRVCVNMQCARYLIIENYCMQCKVWTDTIDGISQPCNTCGLPI